MNQNVFMTAKVRILSCFLGSHIYGRHLFTCLTVITVLAESLVRRFFSSELSLLHKFTSVNLFYHPKSKITFTSEELKIKLATYVACSSWLIWKRLCFKFGKKDGI